eukprot:2441837-Prymnesium_polylepis.1
MHSTVDGATSTPGASSHNWRLPPPATCGGYIQFIRRSIARKAVIFLLWRRGADEGGTGCDDF